MKLELQIGEEKRTIEIENDETLLRAMQRSGAVVNAPCGGKGTCGKCRIRLLRNGKIPVRELLACQTTGAQLVQIWVRERFDTVSASGSAELQDQRKKAISLPEDTLWDSPEGVKCVEPATIDSAEGQEQRYGVAFDIGTTTVAAMLWELGSDGERAARMPLATASAANPQCSFGADVISRMEYVGGDGHRLAQMQALTVQCMNRLLAELTEAVKLRRSNIYRISAVGNTTMMHFLFGKDVSGLMKAPFAGEELPLEAEAKSLGLQVEDGVMLRTLPVMGGHLGADAAAVLLALRLPQRKEAALALDIGTNGELLITDGTGRVWGCTTAAGPAFEGGNIGCGMRGEPGAIETVRPAEDGRSLNIGVIGDGEAKGLCGSGLIDAAASLLALGWMDEEGRLTQEEIRLAPQIALTQRDIRQLQMAKGAIAAGTAILQQQTKREPNTVFLAGAFGSYIRPESAVAIGLLPAGIPVVACGNAAGVGASLILCSDREWMRGCDWAGELVRIELAEQKEFTGAFLSAMYFPTGKLN
ncbi:MAG: DUF4445 domain-containing protein [Firmicutes bacterium]|nr:DUF4445 domain-containing protein [Bacillota bacterium]